jgi:hypothetical protein
MSTTTIYRKGGGGADRTQFGHKPMRDADTPLTGSKQPGEYSTVERHDWLDSTYTVEVNTATGLTDDEFDLADRSQVAALLWSGYDDDGEPLDANYTDNDIAAETRQQLSEDLHRFIADNRQLVDQALTSKAYGANSGDGTGAYGQLGHDLWLTRNGLGAGFWDREALRGELGRELTAAANRLGELSTYVGDDGKIYTA